MFSKRALALVVPLTTVTLLGIANPASAKDGDDREVQRVGQCSASADWKLKAKQDDGRIEVELEVDSNRVGQTWSVRLTDNGTQVFAGRRVTRGPSGSFSVERHTANRPGVDRFVGTARNVATGETCTARLSF